MNPKVLCFIDYYLPGYKAGGPVRTIVNMVELLGDDIEFLIVTRDRDFKATQPYSTVNIDAWNRVGKAQVFYASSATLSFSGVMRLLKKTPHDVLYLNSFLSPWMTGLLLLIRRLGLYGKSPVILAPRGEFSAGALALKSTKKQIYIALAKAAGLYRKLIWQASSEYEAEDIRCVLSGVMTKIFIAPDLLSCSMEESARADKHKRSGRESGPLRVIFLSRISPMKNLDFLLRVLCKVNCRVQFSLFGPAEAAMCWAICQNLIRVLPDNISVTYVGEVTPEQVPQAFAENDVFIFPTRGENFGHVIFESLRAGTSVIVSDRTPWLADPNGALEVLALERPDAWEAAITRWACFNDHAYAAQRVAASNYARRYVETSQAVEQNRNLFQYALGRNNRQDPCAASQGEK